MRSQALSGLIALSAIVGVASSAHAQPMMGGGGMPNLAAVVGRPLPDSGMPTGTVSVRVARRMPSNGVAGAEVSAIIRNSGGDLRRRTEKTDADGRALFEGMAPGDEFHAEVTVDGELLKTEAFTLPQVGGLRTMLIAALDKSTASEAQAIGVPTGDASTAFGLGVTAGAAMPDGALPGGALEVRIFDENGAMIPNHLVLLGAIDKSSKIDVRRGKSNSSGAARFSGLRTGAGSGYAAVIDWNGERLGTAPFQMPSTGGARAEIRAPARTADPSVMTIGSGARIVLQMHEDTLQILEMLPFENRSDKVFDPGPGAIEVPLPDGFVSAQPQENGRKIEVRPNRGIAVHGAFRPERAMPGTTSKESALEVAFGFVLPYHGPTRAFVQSMPNGIGPFALITEQIPGLSVSGLGIGGRQERELGGRKYWVMHADGVPAGGVIAFTMEGLPSPDATGRDAAGLIALSMVASAFAFGRRPKERDKAVLTTHSREQLVDRREALYNELVSLETTARAGGGSAPADRRKKLVTRLDQTYRELAALDEQHAT